MIKLTGEVAERTINNVSSSGSLPTVRTFGYESGMRGKLWLKLKRDYVAGYADTIDVVPIGAWYGSGRKAQRDFLSPVLLSIPEHFSMHELFR
jgi:DNA ligase-1